LTGTDFLCSMLALRAWNEGGMDGLNGSLAVAFVFRNRVRAGWDSGNWHEVLKNYRNYSATLPSPLLLGPIPDDIPDPTRNFAFSTLVSEIGGIFNGTKEDTITVSQRQFVPGQSVLSLGAQPLPALYYGRLSLINSEWFLKEISQNTDKHRLIAQVGSLSFWN
jgi:hypothetical protein